VVAECAMPAFRLHRLFASIYSNNPASGRVLEKAGFTREGVQRSAAVKHGELLDLIVHARVRATLEDA
ncbi:MAG: GNAT family protein, partial [Dokdonella sp.]